MPYSVLQEESNIYTVTRLNAEIKSVLESEFPLVWVRGEISNFRIPGSGHYYFTLKDESSQVRAVFFRPQSRHLRFMPESGMQVLCQARVGVYEPRGEYQLIVEVMEPQGVGALQLAFEQLKKKLAAEGLFDASLKSPLPVCPQKIAVVTSPSGAAIRDMLKVFQRSPYSLDVTLFPVPVQGQGAAQEIAAAVALADRLTESCRWDVVIVGRGGGSIEDLWPFNEEVLARALFACTIPTISAVGHEIDFTISDLAADKRMPTPTAAAEWVVHQLDEVRRNLRAFSDRMGRMVTRKLETERLKLGFLQDKLPSPKRRIDDLRLTLDDRVDRLRLCLARRIEKSRTLQAEIEGKLFFHHPLKLIRRHHETLDQVTKWLATHQRSILDRHRLRFHGLVSKLEGLSPLNVLARGYSITYRLPGKKIVTRSEEVQTGDEVSVLLSEGSLECTVNRTRDGHSNSH